VQTQVLPIMNTLRRGAVKKRFAMMHTARSSRWSRLKLLYLVPAFAACLWVSAKAEEYKTYLDDKLVVQKEELESIDPSTIERVDVIHSQKKVLIETAKESADTGGAMPVVKPEDAYFDMVEQMPQFPGGPAALMEFLSKNIRYPKEADKNNIQGRVIVTFTVEKDGSISEAHTVKSVDPLLDAEAIRVINAMPNWIPGRQNGDPVRVKYTVPITFRLKGDAKPALEHIKISPEHKGKEVELVIDGKIVETETLNSINPADIESMHVEKAKDGHPKDRIILKTKNKK
jgi:TonB family protein